MQMSSDFFCNSKRDTVSAACVEGAKQELKGTNIDGDEVYHTSFFDPRIRKHIAYDTVVFDDEHHYVQGSGHTSRHDQESVIPWEGNRITTWQETLALHTQDAICV